MKKLPIIGLLIGAVAALFIKNKNKQAEPEVQGAAQAPAEDTSPPA